MRSQWTRRVSRPLRRQSWVLSADGYTIRCPAFKLGRTYTRSQFKYFILASLLLLAEELGLIASDEMAPESGFAGAAVPIDDDTMDGGFGGGVGSSGAGTSANMPEQPTGMCSCFTVSYYQPYFNVHTSDVQERLRGTLNFAQPEPTFLSIIGDTPDAYGPFWVATTLIFIISVTSNLARTLQSGYTYDFQVGRVAFEK